MTHTFRTQDGIEHKDISLGDMILVPYYDDGRTELLKVSRTLDDHLVEGIKNGYIARFHVCDIIEVKSRTKYGFLSTSCSMIL